MQIQVRRYDRNTHKKKNRFYVFFSFIRQYLCRLKRGLVPGGSVSSLFPPTAAQEPQSCVPAAAHLQAQGCQGAAAKQHVQCLAIAVTDTVLLPTAERGRVCHQALFPGSFYCRVIWAQTCTAPNARYRSSFTQSPCSSKAAPPPQHVRQSRGGKAQQGESQHFSEPWREQVCSAGTAVSSVTSHEWALSTAVLLKNPLAGCPLEGHVFADIAKRIPLCKSGFARQANKFPPFS